MSSGFVSEDAHTFAHTFDFVLQVAPQLASDPFLLLLDGDRATWQAVLLGENMRKRFGPMCKSRTSMTVLNHGLISVTLNSYTLIFTSLKIDCDSTAKIEGKPSVEGLASRHQDHVMIPSSIRWLSASCWTDSDLRLTPYLVGSGLLRICS